MLQRDPFFRRRAETASTNLPAAAPAANSVPVQQVETLPRPDSEARKAEARSERRSEPKASEPRSERKEAKLVVGPDIKMKGVEVVDCDTLIVEGRIEATLDSRVLEIAEHGVFCGSVSVDIAEIHGRLEGELTVRKELIIHATGKVSGKLHYAKIKVEEGAQISGEIGFIDGTKKVSPLAN